MNTPTSKPKVKTLSVFSLVMINIIAVDSLRNLPISAEYGFSIIFFYLICSLIFLVPITLVAAELATAWPKTGGIYIWTREAFGPRVGFMVIWLQWIYNVVWNPTILTFIVAIIAFLINPHLVDNKTYMLTMILVIFWGATLANSFGMRVASWLSTIGAIFGTILPMLFIIILGAIWLFEGKPLHINFNEASFFPDLTSINNLSFLIAVLFGLIGLEMSAVHADDVKNPRRDFPRALLISALIIVVTLIFSALAIAMVLPHNKISLVAGLIQSYSVFFKAYHMTWMTPIIAILIIIGGISGVSAWIIGPTKALMVASQDGSIPPLFKKQNRYGSPIAILILQAVIFTFLCSAFLLMPSVNSTFWILSAMTAQLAMLVYVFMFAAAIRLRYKSGQKTGAFKIPFGKFGMWLTAGVGFLTCIAAIALGFFPPSQIKSGSLVNYETILIAGIILFSLPPLVIYKFRKPEWKD